MTIKEAFAAPSTSLAATIYLLARQGDVPVGSDTSCTVLTGSPRICNLDMPIASPGAPWYVLVGRTTLAGSSAQSVSVTAQGVSSCSLGRTFRNSRCPCSDMRCNILFRSRRPGAARTERVVARCSAFVPRSC